mmetsp:Transcript_17844/g.48530  ORF Transcript_17844/g.48530 Transcript_17844/m.48530 type:complete len:278 (+) Transcript_17844:3752-4585(+)
MGKNVGLLQQKLQAFLGLRSLFFAQVLLTSGNVIFFFLLFLSLLCLVLLLLLRYGSTRGPFLFGRSYFFFGRFRRGDGGTVIVIVLILGVPLFLTSRRTGFIVHVIFIVVITRLFLLGLLLLTTVLFLLLLFGFFALLLFPPSPGGSFPSTLSSSVVFVVQHVHGIAFPFQAFEALQCLAIGFVHFFGVPSPILMRHFHVGFLFFVRHLIPFFVASFGKGGDAKGLPHARFDARRAMLLKELKGTERLFDFLLATGGRIRRHRNPIAAIFLRHDSRR